MKHLVVIADTSEYDAIEIVVVNPSKKSIDILLNTIMIEISRYFSYGLFYEHVK